MDPRVTFARIFSPNAGDFQFPRGDAASFRSDTLQETQPRYDAGDYFMPRRVGEHHFGSPAMQSLMADAKGPGDSLLGAMQSMVTNANPQLAQSMAQATIQRSLVDQYGNRINDPQIAPPPMQGGPPAPQGESQQGRQAPGADTGGAGTSTTTMLLLGGGAFLAVMLLLRKKKR